MHIDLRTLKTIPYKHCKVTKMKLNVYRGPLDKLAENKKKITSILEKVSIKNFKFLKKIFVCMNVLPACMSVYYAYA